MEPLIEGVVVVDTSVWVDYFRDIRSPQTDWVDRVMDRQRIGTLDLVLCEVLQGIPREAEFQEARRQLLEFELLDAGGQYLAIDCARNYRTLRAQGITIRKTIDCIIATYCIRHGHSLLHNDRDFDPFESCLGLRVVHPANSLAQIH